MINIITVFFAFGFFYSSTIAAETNFGFGTSLNSTATKLFFPVNINNTVQISPYAAYSKSDITISGQIIDRKYESLGLGLFYLNTYNNSARFYIGSRIGVIKSSSERIFSAPNTYSLTGLKYTAYSIAPTIGFEYFLSKKVSISVDASMQWLKETIKTKQQTVDGSTNLQEYDNTVINSLTNAVLNYHF